MKITPTIKVPCPANWDKMKIGVNSRFCGSCEKNVVDFTQKTREEILEYLILHYGTKTCGRFYRHQLDYADTDFMVTVQALSTKQKDPRLAMAILVFGSMLMTSCNSPAPSAPSDTKSLLQQDSIELVSQTEIQDSVDAYKQNSIERQDSILATAKKAKEDSLEKCKTTDLKAELHLVTVLGDFSAQLEFSKLDSIIGEEANRINEQTDPIDYIQVEVKPEFPGGIDGIYKFISQDINYPTKAKQAREEGRVYVSFIINKEGAVRNPKIVRGVSPTLDSAALHTISKLPQWKPGENHGKKVEVEFTIPVNFRL